MRRLSWLVTATFCFVCHLAIAQSAPAPSANTGSTNAALASPLAEADRLYRAGKFMDAMHGYEEALKQNAKSAAAYEGAVRCYLKQDLVQQAWTTAQEGLKQAPEQSLTHSAMGEVLFRKAKIEEAQREFITAYNLSDRDARAPYGLYRVYRSASYYARAKQMLETAHAIDPQYPDIHRAWMATRPRKEKIAALEHSLAQETDQEERAAAHNYLEFLKAADKQPQRTCRVASKVTETQVPLKVLMPEPNVMRGVEIKLAINGKDMHLLLDTGASGILIRRGPANGAGLVPALPMSVSGVGDEGSVKGYAAYADSIKVGELEFQNCIVEVADAKSKYAMNEVDGLIGADVFASYLVTIDFPGEMMKLRPLPNPPNAATDAATLKTKSELSEETEAVTPHDRYIPPEMRNYTPFFRFGHHMLIPTKIGNVEPKLFLIDSGASSSFISPEAAREVTSLGYDIGLRVGGLSGEVNKVSRAQRTILQFGHVSQEHLQMIAFDTTPFSRQDGVEISGFIGYTALAFMQMDIDYRDGLVNFTYDPKKYRPLLRR
jgi:tetratricopeptide (TPR) repeat protein